MQLLSKLANGSFLVPRIRINGPITGIGGGGITINQQSRSIFLRPQTHRIFTQLTSGKKNVPSTFKNQNDLGRLLLSSFKTTPFASPKSVAKFHGMDGLSPKNFTLIYKSDFQWYLIIAQITVCLALGAILVCIAAVGIDRVTPEEVKAKLVADKQARILEMEKTARDEIKIEAGLKEADAPGVVDNMPSMADVISEDLGFIGFFFVLLVTLGLSIFRLMTMLPVRIYVGKKHHCVGIYYGSLIPGKLVRQEFVAGTVTLQKSSLGFTNNYYKDGSGRSILLFGHFFRRPADFNYVTGITKSFEYEEDTEDELSQLKTSGSFAGSSKWERKQDQQ